jgi:hypothetical protein
MEGGIAIILLLLIVVVGGALAVAFTSLGGALSLRRRKDSKADAAAEERPEDRPLHTQPTTPYHEHTRFDRPEHDEAPSEAGTRRD